jgi:hypothetical protein
MASAVMLEIQSTTQEQPPIDRSIEKAGQTFQMGVPLMVDQTSGGLQEWDGATVANGIAGVSKEFGANLTTTGVAKTISVANVPNQPLAVTIPHGAPANDGRSGYAVAVQSTIFYGQVGPAQTVLPTDVTKQYGMTKDTDGHWYVDKSKTGGAAAVVQIVKLDYWDTTRGVHFVFIPSAIQKLG